MPLVLSLSPEEEAQFDAWAAQQGKEIQRDAHAVVSALAEQSPRRELASHFFKALQLTQPVLHEAAEQELGIGQYLLLLLKAMTVLYHAHEAHPAMLSERSRRTLLDDAVALYDLGVVPVGTAARIAQMSVREFIFTAKNRRRIDLIRKLTREGLTLSEDVELQQLQSEVRQQVDARHPLPVLVTTGVQGERAEPQAALKIDHTDEPESA